MTIRTLDIFEEIIEKEYQASVKAYLNEQASFVRTGIVDVLVDAPAEYDQLLNGRLSGDCNGNWTPTVPVCAKKADSGPVCDDQHNLGFQTDAYKDKAHIVTMRPQKFLSVASPLRTPHDPTIDKLRERIKSCKPIDTPFLEVDLVSCKVTGHEGRHRAVAAAKEYAAEMPVIIYHQPIESEREHRCLKSMDFGEQLA